MAEDDSDVILINDGRQDNSTILDLTNFAWSYASYFSFVYTLLC